jgi:hypothetical protein
MLPDFDRADRIGEFWGYPESRAFAELLIDSRRTGRCGRCSSACCERPTRAGSANDGADRERERKDDGDCRQDEDDLRPVQLTRGRSPCGCWVLDPGEPHEARIRPTCLPAIAPDGQDWQDSL